MQNPLLVSCKAGFCFPVTENPERKRKCMRIMLPFSADSLLRIFLLASNEVLLNYAKKYINLFFKDTNQFQKPSKKQFKGINSRKLQRVLSHHFHKSIV